MKGSRFFRIFHALIAAPALLAACAAQQQVTVRHETSQTYSPEALVTVLQALPAQPYVRIAVLDIQAAAGTPKAQLLAQLQAKAGALGANAIVVQDLSTQETGGLQYNPAGGQFSSSSRVVLPHLRAIAIRTGTQK
jgi:hypothetical protein